MIISYLVLFGILLVTPRLWFRWWQTNRFTAYAWGILVFMACFGLVFLAFGGVDWVRTLGLFAFMLLLTVGRGLHLRKREAESRAGAEGEKKASEAERTEPSDEPRT